MIIIGDIHGCYKTLMALIAQFPKDEKICFVGDLIDRGEDSKKVLDFVLDKYDCVQGNHEEMMLMDRDMWLCNGGHATRRSIGGEKVDEYKERIKRLPYYLEYDIEKDGRKLLVCHAGIINEDIESCIKTQMITWYRGDLPDIKKYFQVIGHTPVKEPIITEHYANIDTGCVFNRDGYDKLTALQFPEMKIYQQKNIE